MRTCSDPNVRGRSRVTILALGVAAAISTAPDTTSADEFLIPSFIAPVDPLPRLMIPSRTSQPSRQIPVIVPSIRELEDQSDVIFEVYEAYDRIKDKLIADGMPNFLEPHRFAARCLVAATPDSKIDALTIKTWTEVWYYGNPLRHSGLSRENRLLELRKHLVFEAKTKDTWPHKNTIQTCIDTAPTARASLQTLEKISSKIVIRTGAR